MVQVLLQCQNWSLWAVYIWRPRREQKQLHNRRGVHEDLRSRGWFPVVRQGPGHRRRGKAGERGGAQGTTHHSPCIMSSSLLLPGGEAAVSCEPHWASSPGREWQKVNPRDLFVIISDWSHAAFSHLGTLTQPPSRAGLQCSWALHLGLENSIPFCSWFGSWDHSSIFFWKYRICQDDRPRMMSGPTMLALSKFFFLFFCREHAKSGPQKPWSLRRTPAGLGFGCFWNSSVSSQFSPLPSSARRVHFLSSMGLHVLILSHPVGLVPW